MFRHCMTASFNTFYSFMLCQPKIACANGPLRR
ncbi:hypothetical protein ABIC80_004688 [Kosakonia sp. 1610]